MKTVFRAILLTALLATAPGCVEDGNSADCNVGGRGNLEEEGCLTPIGGSCLTEEEFKKDRPQEREVEDSDGDTRTVTIDEDWAEYQEQRPECDFTSDE